MEPYSFKDKPSAALFYADRGFYVFPVHYIVDGKCSCGRAECENPGKHPMTKRGLLEATNDKKKVFQWWRDYPDANIGIRTGPESGIFVVDLDVHEDRDGNASLQKLAQLYGDGELTITTAWQRTGSGGRHIIYKYPEKGQVLNLSTGLRVNGVKYPGIDIRGKNGYILAAPSNHKSGGVYEYYDNPIEQCPEWLLKIVTERGSRHVIMPTHTTLTQSEIDVLTDELVKYWGTDRPESKEGHGHRVLIGGVATISKRHGIDRDSILGFLLKFNREHPCVDGIHPVNDIARIVDDYYDREYALSSSFPPELAKSLYGALHNRNFMEFQYDRDKKIVFDALNKTFHNVETVIDAQGQERQHWYYIANIDITFRNVVRDDDYDDPTLKYKIDCVYMGRRLVMDRHGLTTMICEDNGLLSSDRKHIFTFMRLYIESHMNDAEEYHADPIYWDSDNIVHVVWLDENNRQVNFPPMNIKSILTTLHEIHRITTNPNAFVRTMAWSILAPFSLYFRRKRVPVPFKAQVGARESAKTEMSLLFVGDGFNRDTNTALIGENEVFTTFTVTKLLSSSKLPFVLDDVSNALLQKRESFFKNIYLGEKSGSRGRSDQSVTEYMNTRNFILTINTEMDVDAASESRYIIDRFTEEHARRQNISLYNTLKRQLPKGFLLALMREIFDGMNMDQMLETAIAGVRSRSEQNNALMQNIIAALNDLCLSHGVEPFTTEEEITQGDTSNPMDLLCQEIISAHNRINMNHDGKKQDYLSDDIIDVENGEGFTMVWFTSNAYMRIHSRYRDVFKMDRAGDFIQNTIIPPTVEVVKNGRAISHRFPGNPATPVKAFCLKYSQGNLII